MFLLQFMYFNRLEWIHNVKLYYIKTKLKVFMHICVYVVCLYMYEHNIVSIIHTAHTANENENENLNVNVSI